MTDEHRERVCPDRKAFEAWMAHKGWPRELLGTPGGRLAYEAWCASAAAMREDAERYRWLREHFRFAGDTMRELWFDPDILIAGSPNDLDSAIDTARRALGDK